MKIVFVTDVFFPYFESGGVVHTFHVARNLVKMGHEVTVLCDKTSLYSKDSLNSLLEYEVIEGINIIRSKKPYQYGATIASLPALFETYTRLKKMIRNGDVDVVNAVLYRPIFPVFFAAKNNIPCIITIHLTGFKEWSKYEAGKMGAIALWVIGNMALRLPFDKIITVSKTLRDELLDYYPKDKIEIIYNGVDLKQIDSVICGEKNPNQIIYIGSLNRRKNIMDAIKAVELARKEKKIDLNFIIVSGGGEYEDKIKQICNNKSFIKYYKNVADDEKIKLLKESSLLIHPSLKESFGIVAIEALACNTPFLAYDIPALKEVCQISSGGVIVKQGDYVALSQKICELLNDKIKLKQLAIQGRENVQEVFTWERVAKRKVEIYNKVLDDFRLKLEK